MSFTQVINRQPRRTFSDRGRPFSSSSELQFIEDAAPRYDSTEIKKPAGQNFSGWDLEIPNPWDNCGWQCADQLGEPVQRQDPFNHIGQYNGMSSFEDDRLAPLRESFNDVLIGVEYQNSVELFESVMGSLQQMFDVAMAGSTGFDVPTGLFGPTLSFDKQGNLQYFEHMNGYGARRVHDMGDNFVWAFFYKDTAGNYHEVGYDEFNENAGGVFSGILQSIGETLNDIGEGISNFFSDLFGSDIIVKPGAEETGGHLGGLWRIDAMACEQQLIGADAPFM